MAKEATRTLLVKEESGGQFKVTVPESYKVTFGPIFTRRKVGKWGEAESPVGSAIRIYEAENKQRAVFTGIESFRDLSLPVTRLIVEKSGQSKWVNDSDGNESLQRTVVVKTKGVKEDF